MMSGNIGKDGKLVKQYKEELQNHLKAYFDSTTVHGLRYITERRRPWPEKVLWFIGIAVSVVACVWLMYKTCMRWVESPVIIAMDESQRAVWQIPFPAVTICPQAKINGFLNLTDFVNKYDEGLLTEDQIQLLAQVQTPCKIPIIIDNDRKINDSDPTDVIEHHALNISDVITAAYFQSHDETFQPILTEEGLCYSFNMMPAEEFFREGTFHATRNKYLQYEYSGVLWDPTRGYAEESGRKAYPRRSLGAGKDPGLQLHLHTERAFLHSVCNFLGKGFQVVLHSPIEFPQIRRHSVYVPLDSVVQISMAPTEMRTNHELRRSYSPEQRQCYFPDERRLRFFKHYTQSNCELECLANLTLVGCNCVEFHMPRMPDTPVCGMSKKLCTERQAALLNEMTAEFKTDARDCRADHPCACMQNCMDILYDSDRSQTALNLEMMNRYLNRRNTNSSAKREEIKHRSIVFIYYKDSNYIPIRRVEVFGTTDLLASLGGVMGLCMGISLLSVIEFFYWLLIRPCCQQIKQSDPLLRSMKKQHRAQMAETAVQYSRYLEDEVEKQQP